MNSDGNKTQHNIQENQATLHLLFKEKNELPQVGFNIH